MAINKMQVRGDAQLKRFSHESDRGECMPSAAGQCARLRPAPDLKGQYKFAQQRLNASNRYGRSFKNAFRIRYHAVKKFAKDKISAVPACIAH